MSLFKKKSDAEFAEPKETGSGRNRVSILILLLLVGAFAYLYFFTNLIVPHEEAAPAKPAPPAATPQVKQSMPPRPAAGVTPPAQPQAGAEKPAEAKPAAGTPPQAAPPAPAAPQATAPPAKKEVAPPIKKEEVKAVKPAEQKPAPAAAKKEEPKPVKVAEKGAAEKGKQPAAAAPQAAKKEQKPAVAEEKVKAEPAVKSKAPSAPYLIHLGEFTAGEAAAVEAKLKKHKVKIVKSALQKNRQMTRLFYGSYSDYDSYSADLEKLKKGAKGAFAIEKDGVYKLYAGSFSSAELASAEKKRLAGIGLKVEAQQVSLPIATVRFTAGPFQGKGAADKVAAALKKEGLKVKVIPKGK